MKIKTLSIKKYQMLKDLDIFLPSTNDTYFGNMNLTVVVGENGTGKTSLLKFISEIFFDTNHENRHLFNHIEYEMDDNRYICYRPSSDNIPSKVIVSTFSPYEQFKKFNNKNYSFIGASSSTKISRLFLSIINQMSSSEFKKRAAMQSLISEVGYINPPLIEIDPKILSEEFLISNTYQKQQILNKLKSHFYQHRIFINNKELLKIGDLETYEGGAIQWINDIKKFKIFDNYRIKNLWFPKNGDLIPITHFSSGELTLFYRFFLLIDVIVDNSVVLIDEPETHLHPKWIKKYTKLLRDVFSNFKTHIIIATHSPLIASDIPKECIMGLKSNNNSQITTYYIGEQTLGTNPREILKDVFEIDSYFGDFTNDIVKRIENYLENNNLEKALKLYNDLGDSELKFELFLKLEYLLEE